MKDRCGREVKEGMRVCVLEGGAAGRCGVVEQLREEFAGPAVHDPERMRERARVQRARVKGDEDPEFPFEAWYGARELAVVGGVEVGRGGGRGRAPLRPMDVSGGVSRGAEPPLATIARPPGEEGIADSRRAGEEGSAGSRRAGENGSAGARRMGERVRVERGGRAGGAAGDSGPGTQDSGLRTEDSGLSKAGEPRGASGRPIRGKAAEVLRELRKGPRSAAQLLEACWGGDASKRELPAICVFNLRKRLAGTGLCIVSEGSPRSGAYAYRLVRGES